MSLSKVPLFGWETKTHHYGSEESGIKRNAHRLVACLPILGIKACFEIIFNGVDRLDRYHPSALDRMKGAAFIMRGALSILGLGILFLAIDIIIALGRTAFRPANLNANA